MISNTLVKQNAEPSTAVTFLSQSLEPIVVDGCMLEFNFSWLSFQYAAQSDHKPTADPLSQSRG